MRRFLPLTGRGPAWRRLASPNPGPEHEALGRGNIAEERNPAAVSYSIEIPTQLEEWAALAGYRLTDETDDGRAMFWSAGGDVRNFIGTNDSGWFTVPAADRFGPEYRVFL